LEHRAATSGRHCGCLRKMWLLDKCEQIFSWKTCL